MKKTKNDLTVFFYYHFHKLVKSKMLFAKSRPGLGGRDENEYQKEIGNYNEIARLEWKVVHSVFKSGASLYPSTFSVPASLTPI